MTFAWPWIFLLLPLYWLIPKSKNSNISGALDHPFLMNLAGEDNQPTMTSRIQLAVNIIIWVLLLTALARPQWIGPPVNNESKGRSLYFAVDLSESMLERDMDWNGRAIERYQAVQAVVGEFVTQRDQDFLGLVVFGSYAEIQSPLTPDTLAIKELLADLRPGMAEARTAIGDGLALSVKQLRESESQDKVIILLSDGENNSGSVSPEDATRVAQQSNIKVYTIGFGGNGRQSLFGSLGLNNSGIDEATLQDIAKETNGQYFRASSTRDLADVFKEIEKLEPSEEHSQDLRTIVELYWVTLLAAFMIQLGQLLWPALQSLRREHDFS
jgi:Ca-activated chloride channel family protein